MESSSLNQIFGDSQKHKNQTLEEIFKTVANFTLEENELSSKVCKSCLNQMLQIYDGCMTARKNDAYIKKSLAQAQEAIRAGTLKIEKYIFPKGEEPESEAKPAPKRGRGASKKGTTSKAPATAPVPMVEPEFIKLEPIDDNNVDNAPPTPMEMDAKDEEVVTLTFKDPMSVKNEAHQILLDGDVEFN